ncbi:MAG: cyclodeaminase/cyclohydrolase family protein, partial [Bacteroidales bacterium]
AIGWYIEEYGVAQISMNLTNISVTPLHIAFDEVCRSAESRGLRVTGSELFGLVPLSAMLDAGRYFLRKQKRSTGVPDSELIKIAVKSLGLNELTEFKSRERIIEYRIEDQDSKKLISLDLKSFMNETASESVAPGGGSVAAYMGALGTALASMTANISSHKRGWDERWEEFSDWAEKGKLIQNELLVLVDEDTMAFNYIMKAFGMPKSSEEEKKERKEAIEKATKNAILVPFRVMEIAYGAYELIEAMVKEGNPNSVTDAGVGALAVRSCIKGAYLNVCVNTEGLEDKQFGEDIKAKASELNARSEKTEQKIVEKVLDRL